MNRTMVGSYIGTGDSDNMPEITWREQTKEEALRDCLKSFHADVNARTKRYVKECDEIASRCGDVK